MKKVLVILLVFISIKANSQVQKLDSVHLFSWDTNTANWRHNTRELLTFENGGNKETNYLRLSLSNSNWDNFYQTLKKYDAANNLIEKVFQTWDSDTNSWKNGTKDVINYTSNQKNSEFSYTYFSDKWNEKSNTKYTYNSENLAEEVNQKNNSTFTSMVNNTKISYTYTGNLLTEKVDEEWLDWASIWENDKKVVYEYQDGNLAKETTIGWNVSKQVWATNGNKKIEYTYNSENLILESISSLFITSDGVFKGTDKYNYTYSTNQVIATHQQKNLTGDEGWRNYAQQIRKTDTDENLTEHIYQNWNTTLNDWKGFLRLVYFWSEAKEAFSLTIEKQNQQVGVSVFPIPAQDNLNIHFSENMNIPSILYFYDTNGKEIFKKNIQANEQKVSIKIPEYNSSMLFLKINNKLGSSTYKVLVKK